MGLVACVAAEDGAGKEERTWWLRWSMSIRENPEPSVGSSHFVNEL